MSKGVVLQVYTPFPHLAQERCICCVSREASDLPSGRGRPNEGIWMAG